MLPLTDPFNFDATSSGTDHGAAFYGKRCALGFGAMLLALFTLTNAACWWPLDAAASPVERIIQRPVAPESATFSSQIPDVTAPDPGDAPP